MGYPSLGKSKDRTAVTIRRSGNIIAFFVLLQPAAAFASPVTVLRAERVTETQRGHLAVVALEHRTRLEPEMLVDASRAGFFASPSNSTGREVSEIRSAPPRHASDYLIGSVFPDLAADAGQVTAVPAGSPLFIALTNAWRPPEHAALQGDEAGWHNPGETDGSTDPTESVPLPSAMALVSAGLALVLAGRFRAGVRA